MGARPLLVLALLWFAVWRWQPQSLESLIEDFDGSQPLQHWSFSNGPEFPGASGNLSLGPGHAGRGAVLAYRFTCRDQSHCGHYVAALWKASFPLAAAPGAALSLWARFPPDVQPTVRVTDQTGQTLQFYAKGPTLEHPIPGEWQPLVVPLTDRVAGHWGGANTGQMQGSIVEIAILADSREAQSAQGQLNFDDVRLGRTEEANFPLDRAAAVTKVPEAAGRWPPRFGVNIHFLQDDRALDLARSAGFSLVRMDLLWAQLEKKGQYDFAPFDDLMRSLEARRMGVLWILDYGHPEHGAAAPQSEADVAAYARYAATAVAHFRGHQACFEIWNEPNDAHFLAHPVIYPTLLQTASAAIRRQDPKAVVSTGGTAGFDFSFLASLLQSGAAQQASALAVHPYREAGPETLPADLGRLRRLIQRTVGSTMPVWDTEWGYSSYDHVSKHSLEGGHSEAARQRQAVLAVREALTGWVLGLPLMIWYDLRDDGANPGDREHNFGLLEGDNREKAAMKAIRVLMSVTRDHTYAGVIRDVPTGVHAVRFDDAEEIVFVVWNEDAERHPHLRVSPDPVRSITNLLGEPVEVERGGIALEETRGPVYVRLKRR
jgi:Cellulase (glycosyl hydrolase family 5)